MCDSARCKQHYVNVTAVNASIVHVERFCVVIMHAQTSRERRRGEGGGGNADKSIAYMR